MIERDQGLDSINDIPSDKTQFNDIIPLRTIPIETQGSTKQLLLGFANSIFQTSGEVCGESNWTAAARKGTVPQPGKSIQHWENFEADLDHMVEMGVNSYRFSLEWSHIEPELGRFDEAILTRYGEMIAACHARHIEPMLTLYHFNEPLWFTERGGFEKEENIPHFIFFCQSMFKRFNQQVKLWCTLNEPAVQAFSGYFYGQFPPHEHNLQKSIRFLKNALKAHVAVYQTLKQMPAPEETKIGIVHNALCFVPRYKWEPLERWLAHFLTKITNDLLVSFLKTGHFDYDQLLLAHEHYTDPSAPASYDFVGLNFYGNVVIGFNSKNFFGPTYFAHQEMGDMFLPIDQEGFSRAIDDIATLGKPIYITETGIADNEDKFRGKFLQEYFSVVEKKCRAGVDIRGCYFWTFADNYEWNFGYTKKFGLFDNQRIERKSAQEFKNFLKQLMNNQEKPQEVGVLSEQESVCMIP